MGSNQYIFLIYLLLFIHYLVFNIFYSNKEMSLYCYCVFELKEIVFQPQDSRINDSNTFLKPSSTMDLRSYLLQWLMLLVIKLFLSYVQHRINTGI